MKKQKNFQMAIIAVLTFAVLFMSVGFAAYSRQLDISGTTTVSANKWSVHFAPSTLQNVEGSVPGQAQLENSSTGVSFTAELAKPGDYYAFTVDIINDGTFDAILKSITLTKPTAEQQNYIKYSVSYDGESYVDTTSNLNIALNHAAGLNTKTVIVRAEFDKNTPAESLPDAEGGVQISLGASFAFSQA